MDKMDNEREHISEDFLKVFLPNQKRILAYILYYVPNRVDADDVFQNTTSVLWKKFDQYTPGTDFVAWSCVVARFEIMSYFRQKRREGKLHFDEHLQDIIDAEVSTVNSQFDERLRALRECFKKLISAEVKVMKMRYEQDLPFARIAERLGISSPAAFKKVSKIHSRLIQCIRQRIAFGETL